MKALQVLLVGCGDLGITLATGLSADNFNFFGLRREVACLPSMITPICGDVTREGSLATVANYDYDYVVVTLTPGEFTDERYKAVYVDGLKNVLSVLGQCKSKPKRLFFISSTSVYGQDEGELVDESSETTPLAFSGQRLLEAEQQFQQFDIPYSIIRFSGIYGPGRQRFLNRVAQTHIDRFKPSQYTNRIHRDDCAALIAFLMQRDQQHGVLDSLYVGTDDLSEQYAVVLPWLAEQLNVDIPKVWLTNPCEQATGKRCVNQRIRDLGFQLKYPSFREGYKDLIESLN